MPSTTNGSIIEHPRAVPALADGPLPKNSAMTMRPQLSAFAATWTAVVRLLLIGLAATTVGRVAADDDGLNRELARQSLREHCFDCHADGAAEGNFAIDELLSRADSEDTRREWWKVIKNVRAELMPPQSEAPLDNDDRQQLVRWLQREALGIDPLNQDPGHVTLRRLNRTEYRNTIRDLMGIEFASEVEFPPDDTGHGFDTVGDTMSISPLLMEKYLQAAEQIVLQAVPMQPRVPQKIVVDGKQFVDENNRRSDRSHSFYSSVDLSTEFRVEHSAEYALELERKIDGDFDFDPGRCRVTLQLDGEVLLAAEYGWQADERSVERFVRKLEAGEHVVQFRMEPLVDASHKRADIKFEVQEFRIVGPTDERLWTAPEAYARFFSRAEAPPAGPERDAYVREVLSNFATRAFRRPVGRQALDQIVAIAQAGLANPQQTFEQSVARAMIAVLSSPRFLFRTEEAAPDQAEVPYPLIDEFALASRLSYFLWATMPDKRLMELATQGRLRQQLTSEVERMIGDRRFREMCENFVGQWLQTRDVETISIDPLDALGVRQEYEQLREQLLAEFGDDRSQFSRDDHPPEVQRSLDRYREIRDQRDILNGEMRRDLRRETEELFYYIAREDKSLLDLIDGRYSFLNERLAEFYGLGELQVAGDRLRRVELPADSPRGGVLTQGAFLIVTSNPTRTSPVKRGLYILDNFLGTPSPPPPAAVPELEKSAEAFSGRTPTLRELLKVHRQDALCASCHDRFDPLGLALENFNALGLWRDTEAGQPVDAAGELITGEAFANVRELKQILAKQRRLDFYACFTAKLMTYALGRGPEYYDDRAIEDIVERLESSDGQFSKAILGVVLSPAFQRMRELK